MTYIFYWEMIVVHGNVIAIATIILVGKIRILGKYDMIFLKL